MRISRAGKDDYPELAEVWEASVRATHHFLQEEDIPRIKPLLDQYFDAVDLFLIRETDRILGFMGASEQEIQMLFLHPDAIGKGHGKMLVQFAIDEYQVSKVEVNEQNEHAFGFYKHMGFVVESRLETDHRGKPYPLLVMELARKR